MTEAYKPYVDYLLAGGVAETAYIISHEGAICGTNLPIKQFPAYNFEIEDEKDPNVKHNMVVDERANLIEALNNKGVAKNKAGIRLYNQKYYPVRYDEDSKTLYLKKVHPITLRKTEEPASSRPTSSTSSAASTSRSRCRTECPRTQESSTRESRDSPPTSPSKVIDRIPLNILIIISTTSAQHHCPYHSTYCTYHSIIAQHCLLTATDRG